MQQTVQINIQRVDNGFVVIVQNDEPGIKTKKSVALSQEDVKTISKDFIDHIFDEAPPKPQPQKGGTQIATQPTPS